MKYTYVMQYSYSNYMYEGFIWPLILFVLSLFFFLIGDGWFSKKRKDDTANSKENTPKSKYYKATLVLSFIISLSLVITFGLNLLHSYKLIFDKPNVTSKEIGTIEKIEEDFRSCTYKREETYSKASILYISGEKYYIMSDRNLSLNDKVEIEYLPKSKFILKIAVIDN